MDERVQHAVVGPAPARGSNSSCLKQQEVLRTPLTDATHSLGPRLQPPKCSAAQHTRAHEQHAPLQVDAPRSILLQRPPR